MFFRWLPAVLLIAAAGMPTARSQTRAPQVEPETISFHNQAYLVRTINPKTEDLRLYWKDASGQPLHDFTALEGEVRHEGLRLLFAANAGMFQPDFSPVGLLVLDGTQVSPLNLQDGDGNFYLKPNGVFVVTESNAVEVMEASAYAAFLPRVLWATQSGPLMVHHGVIHPDFISDSTNLMIRSGVGVEKDGTIVFALSREPVNFYHFATFFLTRMKCANALYLDGHISAFHVPGEAEKPGEHRFGPMFGLVAK